MAYLVARRVALLHTAQAVHLHVGPQAGGVGVAVIDHLALLGVELYAVQHTLSVLVLADFHLAQRIDAAYCFFCFHIAKIRQEGHRVGDTTPEEGVDGLIFADGFGKISIKGVSINSLISQPKF